MVKLRALLILLLIAAVQVGSSQISETAIWSYVSLSKPINDRWSVAGQTELRTGDDNTRLYLWYVDANAKYKINSWLSATIGFDYIKVHARKTEKRGAVWRTDYRPYIAITPAWTMGPIKANLNESLTYNWFPETEKDGVVINGRGYYLARHRLTLEYPITGSRFTPYTKFEVRHTKKLERIRATLGTSIKLNARNSIDIGYVYQDMHNSTKTNAISMGYKVRLLNL